MKVTNAQLLIFILLLLNFLLDLYYFFENTGKKAVKIKYKDNVAHLVDLTKGDWIDLASPKSIVYKKGDLVQVNAGEDRGKQGKVLEMIPDKQRAIVEGINLVSKHTKPNAAHPQGGIIKKEAPIHISNLNVVDPVTGKPTKIGRRRNAEGKLVRYAKKSGQELK